MSRTSSSHARRIGRRRSDSGTREAILSAAQGLFTERGYNGATIRSIAAGAGVDPALVHHFFGTKEQLFAAAMHLPLDPSEVLPRLLAPGVDGLGKRLVSLFVTLLRELGDNNPMVALIRSAATYPQAAQMLREFLSHAVLERIAAELGMPQARLRASLCASQIMGLALARQVIALEPLIQADDEVLIAAYGPALQHYLTGPLPEDGPHT